MNNKKAISIADEMEKIFKKAAADSGAKVEVVRAVISSGYVISKEAKIVQTFVEALKKNDVKPNIQTITAGTDAGIFNDKGLNAIVVGIGCREIHSKGEYAIIAEMEKITKTLITLVESLA